MAIAGTGGSHRDGNRPYPHFYDCDTRFALENTMRFALERQYVICS